MPQISFHIDKPRLKLLEEMKQAGFNRQQVLRLGVIAIAKKYGFDVTKYGLNPDENNVKMPNSEK
ncbi:MAG: hypothetical protein KGI06_03790 [Candidatus Micrarchaeota archaeon]|nr:hypothetical protein [Candidatus Micrarchaeota archaeon]